MGSQEIPALSDERRSRAWSFEREFTRRLCSIVGSLVGQNVKEILDKDLDDYRSLSVNPDRYTDPKHFAEDYLVASILRKSYAIPIKVDRAAEALLRFRADEAHNRTTNDRLWSETLPQWWGDYSGALLTILGPLGRGELDKIVRGCRHGSGATVGVSSEGLTASKKYDAKPTITKDLLPFIRSIMPEPVQALKRLDSGGKMKVVPGGVFFTAPKDAWIDRGCCKPATWNAWFQQGIKQHMEDRLRIFGVDISTQERNRFLASVAQERGLVTIDLSSASNLNARTSLYLALCHNKCPLGEKWYKLLDLGREKAIRLDPEKPNVYTPLEMFSTMGNAFTFPLESAIFLAVVMSVLGDDLSNVAVYGDDIIVPQEAASEVIARLEFIGFKVNLSKTFLAGKFFESCGTDWFNGQNVRPFYLRVDPEVDSVPQPLIAANRLRSWCLQVYGYCPERYRELWEWAVGEIPHPWRVPISPSLGDTGYHVAYSELNPPTPAELARSCASKKVRSEWLSKATWEGVVVEHVNVRPVEVERRTAGVLLAVLAQLDGTRERPLAPMSYVFGPPIGVFSDVKGVSSADKIWSNRKFDRLWRRAFQAAEKQSPAALGFEPVRGYLRLPSTIKTLVPRWSDELCWL